jgi:PAS domain S-box-containing protein
MLGEADIQTILETIPNSAFVIDASDTVVIANQVAITMFRADAIDLIGTPLRSFLPTASDLIDKIRTQAGFVSFADPDAKLALPGLEPFDVELSGSVLRTREGIYRGAMIVASNVTEYRKQLVMVEEQRKLAEENKRALLNILEDAHLLQIELRDTTAQLSGIIASMAEALIVTDADTRITLLNEAASALIDVPIQKALGRKISELLTMVSGGQEVKEEERPISKAVRLGKPVRIELEDDYSLILANGKKISIAGFTNPFIRDGKILGVVATLRDMTDEKNLDEAKTGFISIASHQLRTPLTSMRWFSEMLMEGDAGELAEEQKHFVDRIYQGVNRMIGLVNLLLQIARVEAGRIKIDPTPINLASITRGVVLTLKADLEKKKQRIDIITDPAELPKAPMDKDVIWQVMQNLLSNAIRYSPEGGVITVRIKVAGDMFEYSVSDNGIGIPKEARARIFEKFFRAENAVESVPEGSGLGLSLVASLVRGWGGVVGFESEVGKGTTFHFNVPVAGMSAKAGEVTLAV